MKYITGNFVSKKSIRYYWNKVVGRDPYQRREKIVVHRYDTYGAYYTMATMIYPLLKQFKKDDIGMPMSFDSGEEWHAELDKMIWTFEQIVKDDDSAFFKEEDDGFLSIDKEGLTGYHLAIQEGLDLFGKRFFSLWW